MWPNKNISKINTNSETNMLAASNAWQPSLWFRYRSCRDAHALRFIARICVSASQIFMTHLPWDNSLLSSSFCRFAECKLQWVPVSNVQLNLKSLRSIVYDHSYMLAPARLFWYQTQVYDNRSCSALLNFDVFVKNEANRDRFNYNSITVSWWILLTILVRL